MAKDQYKRFLRTTHALLSAGPMAIIAMAVECECMIFIFVVSIVSGYKMYIHVSVDEGFKSQLNHEFFLQSCS